MQASGKHTNMTLKRAKQPGITFGFCDEVTGQRCYPPRPFDEAVDRVNTSHQDPKESSSRMAFHISCSPPLSQVTQIPRTQHSVPFTLLLETSSDSSHEAPEACIWHNHNSEHEWTELPLTLTSHPASVNLLDKSRSHSNSVLWFAGELSGQAKHAQAVKFTVKFRTSGKHAWQWAKDTTNAADGEIVYATTDHSKHSSYPIDHFFGGMSKSIVAHAVDSETDDTYLYYLESPVHAANGQESGITSTILGTALRSTRFFSLVRLWTPWLAPRHGDTNFKLDKDGVLLSFLREDGLHVVCLAVTCEDVLTVFENDAEGRIVVKAKNDRPTKGISRVVVAVADTFEVANAAVMYHARKIVSPFADSLTPESTSVHSENRNEVSETDFLDDFVDGLTYCTWNSLGQTLTAAALMDVLQSFADNGIKITNLIIDDGWQSVSSGDSQFKRGWASFEADPAAFPKGLKATTAEIRERFGIHHISVWHALLGYWGGISPTGDIAAKYKTKQVTIESGVAGGPMTVVVAEEAKRMYDDFYTFLSASGIDSVKTDAQFFVDLVQGAEDRRALTTAYQDAWTVAYLRHFSNRAISCMSQNPQMLFHSQLPNHRSPILVRNSDDFFPLIERSHPWHVYCNAYNALLTQHLNVLPDWDMFQTSHPWAGFHAAARCVSGGPIYITDYLNQSDTRLIGQMTALTTHDKTIILRPDRVGKAIDVYNAYDARSLLKIGAYHTKTQSGILAVFNVTHETISEFLSLAAFPGAKKDIVVGSFKTGQFTDTLSAESGGSIHTQLEPSQWDIFSAYSVSEFTVKSKKLGIAMLGLIGKMTGSCAVSSCKMYIEDSGRLRIWTSLKALGTLGLWISDLDSREIGDSFFVLIYGKPIPTECVKKSATFGQVLEIDVEKAWKEGGHKPGWSSEVNVEIFVG